MYGRAKFSRVWLVREKQQQTLNRKYSNFEIISNVIKTKLLETKALVNAVCLPVAYKCDFIVLNFFNDDGKKQHTRH